MHCLFSGIKQGNLSSPVPYSHFGRWGVTTKSHFRTFTPTWDLEFLRHKEFIAFVTFGYVSFPSPLTLSSFLPSPPVHSHRGNRKQLATLVTK